MAEVKMIDLKNPSLPGNLTFETVIYASPGLAYPPALAQYAIYQTPIPAFNTGRINIAAFANFAAGVPWPFTNTNAPLNGHVCIPHGRGPFPLAVFAHGNHNAFENSTPGYLYLCQMLASQGVIAATIDVNFLNGGNFGENDGRAIVHLEHLKQFRTWNSTVAHPLQGKIDLTRILIVGHSRGGEAVGHASFFNRLASVGGVLLDGSAGLGPYRFGLSAAAAIAPTDQQFVPTTGATVVPDPYFVIHGSQDADVSNFAGYHTYNRAHAVDAANPTVSSGNWKALSWVHKANHNYFNSVWAAEGGSAAVSMPRASQEQIARVHLGALTQAVLLDRADYLEVFKDHAVASAWLPAGVELVSQYQDPERVFVQHHQESVAAPQISLPVQGTVATDSVTAVRQLTALVPGATSTVTLRLTWTAPGGRFLLKVDPATLPAERYKTLSLRVGQSTEAGNAVARDQDFTLEVSSGSRTVAIPASSVHRLLYPDPPPFGPAKIIMQTLRLPVQRLVDCGVDPSDVRTIALVFDRRATGVIYAGDLQFSD